ncbi:MAG: flagellin lysine-N-methylase [Lachnoclostridium sp.]|nr:flagellin lysine-N-methylase [Muribaculaceae bacterium]MCM1144122.1 flagellin lysine-N-methylase [Lachnoclostridium sp.]
MEIKRIPIFNEFKCIAQDCPANCCRNIWKIPIDSDMYTKYRNEKGIWGLLLRCLTVNKQNMTSFRNTFRGCPFWGRDHLCSIQKKHGTSYMPRVCIQFPRQLYNLKFFCEETMYLACPEAARLFLVAAAKGSPYEFTVTEGSVSYEPNTTNDDREFLDYLLKSRDELIKMLESGIPFDSMAILHYGEDAQNACLNQTPLPSPKDYESQEHYQITCEKIDEWLFNDFYHPRLRTISPLLYRLCRKYIRKFGRQDRRNPTAANKKLAILQESLYGKIPGLKNILNRYYEYYLLTNFLDIYEDYSFLKHLRTGIGKTHLLWLFIALYAEDRENITAQEIANVMAVYEQRAPLIFSSLF